MAVERIPGERMYIDWVGDQPELLTDPEAGEILKVHVFSTTLGLGNLIYAENFIDEKIPRFIEGTVNAIKFYGGVTKNNYLLCLLVCYNDPRDLFSRSLITLLYKRELLSGDSAAKGN